MWNPESKRDLIAPKTCDGKEKICRGTFFCSPGNPFLTPDFRITVCQRTFSHESGGKPPHSKQRKSQ
jgi:hypothetical protein